ncbi:hypothetical protein [Nonomuraea jiangxiensis]|uniref:Uncharacterized protein n=1 Tax=Nonomuraea jiangxiensis TaxID=633440 RepID=A0A1G9JDS3_9ACTN|nr:hypothetical protein [Nonomuraea jiangxiensis]SDL35395.1 hypothetical protein SAMN05421869_1254 [Nonomuraea jiangxiensis]
MSLIRATPALVPHNAWFPGRFIGGGALVLGPLLWCAGLLLRYLAESTAGFTPEQRAYFATQPFAAPEQPAAYTVNPGRACTGRAWMKTALRVIGALGLERTTELVMDLYVDISYGP